MRRVLFTSFLTLTAFSVLGGSFAHVTAPDLKGEAGSFDGTLDTSPALQGYQAADIATLGENRFANAVPVRAELRQTDAPDLHAVTNDVAVQFPIEVRERSNAIATDANAPQALFLSTWTEIPVAAAHSLGIDGDRPNAVHDNAVQARTGTEPERESASHSRLPKFISALAEVPKAIISRMAIEPPVAMPKSPAAEVSNTAAHVATLKVFEPNAFRGTAAAPAMMNATAAAAPINTFALSPSGDFSRPRVADLPVAPVFVRSAFQGSEHQAFGGSGLQVIDRGLAAVATQNGTSNSVFMTAAYETPSSIFDRPRIAQLPKASAPEVFTLDSHRQIDNGTVANLEDRAEAASQETAANKSVFSSFVTALAEIPSLVFSPAALERSPAPPAPEVYAVNDHGSVANYNAAVNTEREAIAPAERASSSVLPAFVTALAELPASIIGKTRAADLPARPVSSSVAAVPTKSAPVIITANSTMSASMLKPMNSEVLVDAPLADESSMVASNTHLTNGDSVTQFDRALAPTDAATRAAGAAPVLISGRPEFSSDLLKPMVASTVSPFVKISAQEELAAMQRADNFCDPNWVGPPIRFSQTVQLKLEDLINQLHQRFGVNFILGKGVADLPMNVKAGSIPWNVLLRSQLFVSGVRARCIDSNTVELVENSTLPSLQDMADVETRFVKLKFLQRTGSGTVDLAGRGQGGGQGGQQSGCASNSGQSGSAGSSGIGGGGQGGQSGETISQQTSSKFDKLIIEIEKILGIRSMTESSVGSGQGSQGGQSGQGQTTEERRTNRFVTQIPGRNILVIRATKEEHELIDQIIARADRPPFQVVIKGLVYTANQDRLRDIGVQTDIFGGTADNRTTGQILGHTLGAGTLFDFSTIIGTFDFNVQATAFQQNGVISIKSRPFATVIDGLCTKLDVGPSIPIVIDSGLGGEGSVTFVRANNNLSVTPHVVDDESGNPIAVTLELLISADSVDNSIVTRQVPAINQRSIQTQLLLTENKTAILGGFTLDQDRKAISKTPGLGDIPIFGELFKRRIKESQVNRLYFAISVDVVEFPEIIRPVDVPGATTDPPSITPDQKRRSDAAEPKQVKGP